MLMFLSSNFPSTYFLLHAKKPMHVVIRQNTKVMMPRILWTKRVLLMMSWFHLQQILTLSARIPCTQMSDVSTRAATPSWLCRLFPTLPSFFLMAAAETRMVKAQTMSAVTVWMI